MRWGARAYLGLVMVAGLAAAAIALRVSSDEPGLYLPRAILLAGLVALAGLLVVLRRISSRQQATSGVTTLVLFGALLLTSPQTVVLVAAAVFADAICPPEDNRPPWFVSGFNGAQLMLAALSAHAVNQSFLTGSTLVAGAAPVLASIPAVLVFFLVSYALVWGVHRSTEDGHGSFMSQLAMQGVEEFALLLVAALARAAWAVQPWLAILACGPLILFWRLSRTLGRLEGANTELVRSQERVLDGLVRAFAARDNEVAGHCDRVAHSCAIIGRAFGLDPQSQAYEDLVRGSLLHDVGKIGVRDAVLHKPGALTPDEWLEMRDHASHGYALVHAYPFLAGPAGVVLTHHERWDGRGYPLGLKGEAIPLASRIFAVADTFDAITTTRPYRKAQSPEAAVAEIRHCSGAQFDPAVVECFLTLYDQLPIAPAATAAPAREAVAAF